MADDNASGFEALSNGWRSWSSGKRFFLIAGLLSIFVGFGLAASWLLRDDYQVLFGDLNPQDASAMVGELERLKVPYRLGEDGNTILVTAEQVYRTRLKLMGKGMDLQGGVGFEIFNDSDFGMTEFAQKVNFQRALQGELARTIMGFEEIKHARVHLVLPEAGLLRSKNVLPKASISLVMKTGARLEPEQVVGIQRLVAASVPEIQAADVTVIDQRGVALSKESGHGEVDDVSSRLQMKKEAEEYFVRKAVAVLDKIVGPGRAIVTVDVSLNHDHVKVTTENVVPLPNTLGQNVGAISRRRETSQGTDPFVEAVTAGSAALGGVRRSPGGANSSATTEVDFVNGKRLEQIVTSPGSMRRLSVGVMVPDVTDQAELEKLKEVLAMAVGVVPGRGDAIVVYSRPDAPAAETAHAQPPVEEDFVGGEISSSVDRGASRPEAFSWSLYLSFVGLTVILVGSLLWFWKSRSSSKGAGAASRMTDEERRRVLGEINNWLKVKAQ